MRHAAFITGIIAAMILLMVGAVLAQDSQTFLPVTEAQDSPQIKSAQYGLHMEAMRTIQGPDAVTRDIRWDYRGTFVTAPAVTATTGHPGYTAVITAATTEYAIITIVPLDGAGNIDDVIPLYAIALGD